MRLLYPTSQTRQFYQQNAITRALGANVTGVAPHAFTDRNTYTVPAGKRALLTSATIALQRVTAAAPIGRYQSTIYVTLNAASADVTRLLAVDNTVNFLNQMSLGLQVWLAAGDTVKWATEDLSTGGTVSYWGSFTYTEFDA